MGFLNKTKRVDLGDGEWADVTPLSITALRELRQRASAIEVGEFEEKTEAQGYELTRITLEGCVVAWSDEEPVTKENIARLPYALAFKLARAIGLGSEETPLQSGSPSTDT